MTGLFNPLAYPILLRTPQWLPDGVPADGRLSFTMLLVALLEPAQLVEVGIGSGDTFAALCQSVHELRLPTQCLCVELTRPTTDANQRQQSSMDLRSWIEHQYGGFSRVVSGQVNVAPDHIAGDLDLLHLAHGLNEKEAVNAFQHWLPKMSTRGVILVSNIRSIGSAPNLARFWSKSKCEYPHFELVEGNGIGLLSVGSEPAEGVKQLTDVSIAEQVVLRELLYRLGQAATLARRSAFESTSTEAHAHNGLHSAEIEAALAEIQHQNAALEQTLKEQTDFTDLVQARLEVVSAREREFRALYLDLHRQLLERDVHSPHLHDTNVVIPGRYQEPSGLRAELARTQGELRKLHAGRIWRWSMVYWRARTNVINLIRRPTPRA